MIYMNFGTFRVYEIYNCLMVHRKRTSLSENISNLRSLKHVLFLLLNLASKKCKKKLFRRCLPLMYIFWNA